MKTKIFSLLLMLTISTGTMFAYHIKDKIGDLYYYLDTDNQTAEVTHGSNYSNLTSVNIPVSLTYQDVTYSVTSIGKKAFLGSNLTSVTIPNSVTSIGESAFDACTFLTSIEIPNSVTCIRDDAFFQCWGLISVTIGNSVTSIGDWAFYECSSLTSIEIPNSVTSIGKNAFNNCTKLATVTLNSNEIVGKSYSSSSSINAIFGNQVKKYILKDSITSIGSYAFRGCTSLTSIEIPNSVSNIGYYAFENCYSMTSITIPNSITSIRDNTFYGCSKLTSIEIPNSVTSIGYSAFEGCSSLTTIEIPNSVKRIVSRAFYECGSLMSVTIGNGVENIDNEVFAGCNNLTSVTIGYNVEKIGDCAFSGCSKLNLITIDAQIPPSLGSNIFLKCPLSSIIVPCGSLDLYKSQWSNYQSVIQNHAPVFTFSTIATPENSGIVQTDKTPSYCTDSLTLTALSADGYHFIQWTDENTQNPRPIAFTQDTTFEAIFARNPVITFNYNSSQGNISGQMTTPAGIAEDYVTFEAIPNYGYHFTQWEK